MEKTMPTVETWNIKIENKWDFSYIMIKYKSDNLQLSFSYYFISPKWKVRQTCKLSIHKKIFSIIYS